ncbi:hypothetical protein J6590_101182 [Homalodisca vitripennis]|nr:hypothetical protein J6590_101182 [Homalodisca vitripennis]
MAPKLTGREFDSPLESSQAGAPTCINRIPEFVCSGIFNTIPHQVLRVQYLWLATSRIQLGSEKLRTSCCGSSHLYCFGRLFLRATKRWRKIFIFVHVIISPELEQKRSAAVEDKLSVKELILERRAVLPHFNGQRRMSHLWYKMARGDFMVPSLRVDYSKGWEDSESFFNIALCCSGEIPRLDTILRRSALLIPGSMADSSREIPAWTPFIVVALCSSCKIPRLDTIHRRSALLVPGSMADSSCEIPRLDTIHRRSALLVPGSIADSSREILRLVTIHRRSALLVPGSMADSSREIPRVDTIIRRSALLVQGSMADSSREIPRLDTIHRRSALLVPGSMADSSCEIPRLDTIHRRSALLVPGSIADSSREIPRLVTIHRRSALLVPGSMADISDEIVCVSGFSSIIYICATGSFKILYKGVVLVL